MGGIISYRCFKKGLKFGGTNTSVTLCQYADGQGYSNNYRRPLFYQLLRATNSIRMWLMTSIYLSKQHRQHIDFTVLPFSGLLGTPAGLWWGTHRLPESPSQISVLAAEQSAPTPSTGTNQIFISKPATKKRDKSLISRIFS